MDRKGQAIGQIGVIIMVFIAIIVGTILMIGSAQNIHPFRNTVPVANDSVSSAATATAVNLQGQAATDVVVYNGTNDLILLAGNYTVLNNQVVDGSLTATFNATGTGIYLGQDWNVSYTSEPDGYSNNAGARSIAGVIIIFFAIAIAFIAIVVVGKDKNIGDLMRNAMKS